MKFFYLFLFVVEYFSSDLQTGWVVAAHRISGETYVVGNLKPDTNYIFLTRAENSHGLSLPSPISDMVHTLGSRRKLPDHDMDEARVKLSGSVVELKDIQSLSSTAIKLVWEVCSYDGLKQILTNFVELGSCYLKLFLFLSCRLKWKRNLLKDFIFVFVI